MKQGGVAERGFLLLSGMLLLGLAFGHAVYGARAAAAQWTYFMCKYGREPATVRELLAAARRAHRWYPHNYYLAILAAERAHAAAVARTPPDGELWRQAWLWCERGLAQNPWRSSLRWLKTRLLWREAPQEAIRYWEQFTDWNFWEPWNHAVLAELYAKVGEFEKADEALFWARGAPNYEDARRAVLEEARRQAAEQAATLLD